MELLLFLHWIPSIFHLVIDWLVICGRDWDSSSCSCKCRSSPLDCAPGLHWDSSNCRCHRFGVNTCLVLFFLFDLSWLQWVPLFIVLQPRTETAAGSWLQGGRQQQFVSDQPLNIFLQRLNWPIPIIPNSWPDNCLKAEVAWKWWIPHFWSSRDGAKSHI